MKPKHDDFITYIKNKEDIPYLRTNLLNANMRLFKTSAPYREIILQCCSYIRFLALTEMNGYKKPHGMSGANAAIPFNIIGIVRNRGQKDEYCQIMINPHIIEYLGDEVLSESNCGSIRLEKPINVRRRESVFMEYYDETGQGYRSPFTRAQESFTIQHEVDHNKGILITDK